MENIHYEGQCKWEEVCWQVILGHTFMVITFIWVLGRTSVAAHFRILSFPKAFSGCCLLPVALTCVWSCSKLGQELVWIKNNNSGKTKRFGTGQFVDPVHCVAVKRVVGGYKGQVNLWGAWKKFKNYTLKFACDFNFPVRLELSYLLWAGRSAVHHLSSAFYRNEIAFVSPAWPKMNFCTGPACSWSV